MLFTELCNNILNGAMNRYRLRGGVGTPAGGGLGKGRAEGWLKCLKDTVRRHIEDMITRNPAIAPVMCDRTSR